MRLRRVQIFVVQACFLFQFHKGAIKTEKVYSHTVTSVVFQFHKGAIKTAPVGLFAVLAIAFQFHKGAIKTVGTDNRFCIDAGFNSIKVRLRPRRVPRLQC